MAAQFGGEEIDEAFVQYLLAEGFDLKVEEQPAQDPSQLRFGEFLAGGAQPPPPPAESSQYAPAEGSRLSVRNEIIRNMQESDQAVTNDLALLEDFHRYLTIKDTSARTRPRDRATDLELIRRVLGSQDYQQWCVHEERQDTSSSECLAIRGNFRYLENGVSALSCISVEHRTEVHARLADVPYPVWFCSLHTNDDDDPELDQDGSDELISDSYTHYHPLTKFGPVKNMLRSLTVQLLKRAKYDYPDVPLPAGITPRDITRAGLRLLRLIFRHLVHHLARGSTVFCAIDGIDYYYDDPLIREPFVEVVKDLLKLASPEGSSRTTFKLLLTSSKRTEAFWDAFGIRARIL